MNISYHHMVIFRRVPITSRSETDQGFYFFGSRVSGYGAHNHIPLYMMNVVITHTTPNDTNDIDMTCGVIIDALSVTTLHSNCEMLQTNDSEIIISVMRSTGSKEM